MSLRSTLRTVTKPDRRLYTVALPFIPPPRYYKGAVERTVSSAMVGSERRATMRRLVGFSAALMALLLVSFVWREKPHARQVALEDNLASFLQQMEGETFETPDQTYRQSLKGFRSEEQDPKLGMAWAKPSWKDLTPGRSQTSSHPNLNQLEDKIVNDVVRKLGKSLEAKIESKQLLSPAHKVAKSQNSLSRLPCMLRFHT
eukprot:753625-Hanusia_phi.AAC.6